MNHLASISKAAKALAVLSTAWAVIASSACQAELQGHQSFSKVVEDVQPKIVKIYGAGGARGLEAYQSGFLISEVGHILTVWSYVLDTDLVMAVLDDGRKFPAEFVGLDPQLEIAVLKIDATELPCFAIDQAVDITTGSRVLAFSNLFAVAAGNEPASVLHGCVSAATNLAARRGAFMTPYKGIAYILDALTNNPGAAGGALTDRKGKLAGLLGKELRNSQNNTWLNYAIPISALRAAVDDVLAGRSRPRVVSDFDRKPAEPVTLSLLGIVLLPDVIANTPPYVDQIIPGSAADEGDLRPDDMIILVNDRQTRTVRDLKRELTYIDRIDEVRLVVLRGRDLIEVSVFAPD
jgi:serine protease Do